MQVIIDFDTMKPDYPCELRTLRPPYTSDVYEDTVARCECRKCHEVKKRTWNPGYVKSVHDLD